MPKSVLLNAVQREAALPALFASGWQAVVGRDAIEKTYQFKSFITAFGWMTRAALWIEKYNHHPEWNNVYGRVHVVLTTHEIEGQDGEGLSELDIKLATRLDKLVMNDER